VKTKIVTILHYSCLYDIILSHSLEIGAGIKNPATVLHLSQGQQNPFFHTVIPFTIFIAIILVYGACLVKIMIAEEKPLPSVSKGLEEAKISRKE